jgi:hypothetical protein
MYEDEGARNSFPINRYLAVLAIFPFVIPDVPGLAPLAAAQGCILILRH